MVRQGIPSDATIRAAKPGDKLSDGGARGKGRLILVVTQTGRKTFHYRFRAGKSDRTVKLGDWPALSLADARKEIARRTGMAEPMRRGGTFGQLLDQYVASLKARGAASAMDVEGELRRSIPGTDPVRSREARAITADDIDDILTRKSDKGRVTTRVNRLRSMLSAAFNHGRKKRKWKNAADSTADVQAADSTADVQPPGRIDFLMPANFNPVDDVARNDAYERPRNRILTQEEIRAFYAAMGAESARLAGLAAEVRTQKGRDVPITRILDQGAGVAAFWQVVALTGQRAVQLLKASEIEIPSILNPKAKHRALRMVDTKGKDAMPKPHSVPLTPRLAALWPTARLAAAANMFTVRGAANKLLKEVAPDAVPMDLRRTIETYLDALGVSRADRAELLSHGDRDALLKKNGSGVQARHYEHGAKSEQKLRALRSIEEWVVGEVMGEPRPPSKGKPKKAGRGRRKTAQRSRPRTTGLR